MCGFVGTISRGELTDAEVEATHRLTDLLARRGPDDSGHLVDSHSALGFRRLAVMDLSPAGHQPMTTPDGRWALVFNGEIYNHRSLRADLESEGVRFVSRSDTEVVLHALVRWGEDALPRLNGMFALALVDRRDHSVLLARDPLGIKPLAWLEHPKGIVFSSQYDAVIRHPWCERQRLRPDVTALFLRFGYVPSPYGIVEGTRQVPQGSIVRWSPNGPVRHTRYWAVPEASPPLLRGDEAQRQVLSAIRTAVDRQLVADVPVGTFLSGGIDSPLVTAVAHAGHSAPVPAFTIGTDDVDLDESGQAARYARQLQVAHQVETITETDALNLFDDVIDAYGEPFGDISAFPTMLVSRLARKHVTVALSGDGGDELFFGYPRMWNALRWRQTFHLPPLARRAVRKALHRWPSLQPNEGSTIGTIGDMVSLPHSEFGGRRLRSIAPGLGELPGDFDLYDLESVPKRAELAQWLRRNEMVGHLEKMLLKVDRASMHESLEVRVPLLDDEVVSAAIATDPEVCMDGGIGKLPLRQALADYVPESIITKPKKGFDPPLANWFRGALSDRLVERVVENPVVLADAFDRNEVRQLVDSHQMGQDNSRPLWHLLALQEWAERHLRPLPRS